MENLLLTHPGVTEKNVSLAQVSLWQTHGGANIAIGTGAIMFNSASSSACLVDMPVAYNQQALGLPLAFLHEGLLHGKTIVLHLQLHPFEAHVCSPGIGQRPPHKHHHLIRGISNLIIGTQNVWYIYSTKSNKIMKTTCTQRKKQFSVLAKAQHLEWASPSDLPQSMWQRLPQELLVQRPLHGVAVSGCDCGAQFGQRVQELRWQQQQLLQRWRQQQLQPSFPFWPEFSEQRVMKKVAMYMLCIL